MTQVLQTPSFKKVLKKIHQNQKKELDSAILEIIKNPYQGEQKKGVLSDVFVYKFKMVNQLTLLAYMYNGSQIILLDLGSHENFYRDLQKRRLPE